HHQAYINNVNSALEAHPALAAKPVEELIRELAAVPEAIRTTVRNNGGGHANHSLFWTIMSPGAGGEPTGAIGDATTGALGRLAPLKANVPKAGEAPCGRGGAGVAGDKGKKAGHQNPPQSGQPDPGRAHPDSGARRLGTRLLSPLPEPPARLHQRLL